MGNVEKKQPDELCPVQKFLCFPGNCKIVHAWKTGADFLTKYVGAFCVKRRRDLGLPTMDGVENIDNRYY